MMSSLREGKRIKAQRRKRFLLAVVGGCKVG